MQPKQIIISNTTPLAGAQVPFVYHSGYPFWLIESLSIDGDTAPVSDTPPALRWVNGSQVSSLHLPNVGMDEFVRQAQLRFSTKKGAYVLSKRISRVFRTYYAFGFFPANAVSIHYDASLDTKSFDGAGIVSRAMLLRMVDQLPRELTPSKRREIIRELRTAKRVEFTIVDGSGQSKGHAYVAENLDTDFRIPVDIKREIAFDGGVMVGFNFPHAKDDLWLDIQTIINLHPFIQPGDYKLWLDQTFALWMEKVRSGEAGDMIAQMASDDTDWFLAEYFASGGKVEWFASIMRSVMRQYTKRIEQRSLAKMRLPVPGARYYIMSAAVKQAAGAACDVQPGQVELNADEHTAWVNDQDWHAFIAGVLGGADQDDSVMCIPFTDHDGTSKVILVRNPNQMGEYIILEPTATSAGIVPAHMTVPQLDSRSLPKRIDQQQRTYLGLIDPATAGGLGEDAPYSLKTMEYAIERATANKATLGMMCNTLMVMKALWGDLSATLPARLEEVIDADVKTGEDLSAVKAWCMAFASKLMESGTKIPCVIHKRVHPTAELPTTTGHWLDELETIVTDHLAMVAEETTQLERLCCPPLAIFAFAVESEMAAKGIGLRSAYNNAVAVSKVTGEPIDFERSRAISMAYLERFDAADHTAIVAGALADCYAKRQHDSVAWQMEVTAPITLKLLRDLGCIDTVADLDGTYPTAAPMTLRGQGVHIRMVWFNMHRVVNGYSGEAGDIPKEERKRLQGAVNSVKWHGSKIAVRQQDERLAAFTAKGSFIGLLDKESLLGEGEYHIAYHTVTEGDLRAVLYAA